MMTRTLSFGTLKRDVRNHSRNLKSSSCGGLSNAQYKKDTNFEQAGFVGEKYCRLFLPYHPATILPNMLSVVSTLPPMAQTIGTAVQRRLHAPPWNLQAARLTQGMNYICTVSFVINYVSSWDSGTAIECSKCHNVIFHKLWLHAGRVDSLFFEDAIRYH